MWVRDFRFDLFFVWGIASLLLLWVSSFSFVLLPIVLLLDAPHFGFSFVRAFFDQNLPSLGRRARAGAWIFFLLPFLISMAAFIADSPGVILNFSLLVLFVSAYHTISQHYGFLRIYTDAGKVDRMVWSAGLLLPFLVFIFLFDVPVYSGTGQLRPHRELFLWSFFISSIILAFSLRKEVRARRFVGLLYSLWFCTVYYFLLAIFVPDVIFAKFGLVPASVAAAGALLSLFHNLPFLSFFFAFTKGIGKQGGSVYSRGSSWMFVLAYSFLFSAAYFSMGQFSWSEGAVFLHLGFGFYYGCLLQHYYMETKIWRFSKDPVLRNAFGV